MPSTQPLTDSIVALTTYANTITSAGDTTLSDAVSSLIEGYGGGGLKSATGSVTFDSVHNTAKSVEIVSVSTIGFTPTKFYLSVHTLSAITGTQYAMIYAAYEIYGTDPYYIRTGVRYTNTTGSVGGWYSLSQWTSSSNGQLYLSDGKIYFRAGSGYILAATQFDWIAFE